MLTAVALPALVLGLLVSGALGGAPSSSGTGPATEVVAADPVDRGIAVAQERLARLPRDSRTWASLSLLYISKAKATGDPGYYAKADGSARRSLAIDNRTNDLGYAALAAVSSAQHDFRGALVAARHGLAVNDYSATLYGALADALVQLGQYEESSQAVDRLNRLRPGVPAFTRASYDRELHGDIAGARTALEQALRIAVSPSDQAFVRTYLGELALGYQGTYGGNPSNALGHFDAGLRLAPRDPALRGARARALVALGRTGEALAAYQQLVSEVPQPQYVLEYAELLDREGRDADARDQYALFRTEEQLFRTGGVQLDVETTLFEADHGSPAEALVAARQGWSSRPFLEMADAYAWALYRNHRYAEALRFSDRALVTGWPNALVHFHRGMIEKAMGLTAAARLDLQKALQLSPRFHPLHAPEATAALKSLPR
ncbi:MAG TPA: tetratricopeptide repeat protein [Mycobacteriales bacterium]|nr:tetratricopeptide repeat protein [Mycobacteriales bacterium]